MKNYILFLSFLLIGLTSCKPIGQTASVNDMEQIDFENSDNVLLDVRTAEEYEEGHLPNSINLNVNSEDFNAALDTLDKSKTYYVYCKSGKRSTNAVNKLHKAGVENLINLKDGYSAYKK